MPIYEYQADHPDSSCKRCRRPFEVFQGIRDLPLEVCPECRKTVKKLISWCRSEVAGTPGEAADTEKQIRRYEKEGMWSHAAELADKRAEKIKSRELRTRALENYEKAGYDAGTLSRLDQCD